jgi:hypothetical protein
MGKYFKLKWVLTIAAVAFTFYFVSNAARVERYYSNGFYQYISKGVRLVAGPFPFSIGDILYMTLIVLLMRTTFLFFKQLKKEKRKMLFLRNRLVQLAWVFAVIWLCFQWLWGINYYREDIPQQFNLDKKHPDSTELDQFASMMLSEVIRNAPARAHVSEDTLILNTSKTLDAFQKLALKYPKLAYKPSAFKSSIFGIVGNYMGYSGYFNPLSGEAQVNTHMPAFVQPFTGLHEVAHQLGYAKESEANFIGFLAAHYSGDSILRYSASLEMFLFARGAVHRSDSLRSKALTQALPDIAKIDLETYKNFYRKYQGPVDDITTWFYNHFLKFNNQPEGMYSYNRGMVYALRYILDNRGKYLPLQSLKR